MKTLILGTANFGNIYGISNKGIPTSSVDVKQLVSWAQLNGVNNFDTAMSYGSAETILGNSLDIKLSPCIDTKLDYTSCSSREEIVKSIIQARERLRVDQLSTVYLHNEELLHSSYRTNILNGLRDILDLGITRQVGVSLYSGSAITSCKKIFPEFQVFQVPENVCDRRLYASDELMDFAEAGNTLVVRSVFLQGLLLMHPNSIPEKLEVARKSITNLHQFCSERSISVIDLCLAYVKSIKWSDRYIVGVTSVDQLNTIVKSSLSLPDDFERYLQVLPEEVVDPRRWQL